MTPAHRVEAVVAENGRLLLEELPFRAGQTVEVIVLPRQDSASEPASLHNTLIRYDRPTEPVSEADWDVLR